MRPKKQIGLKSIAEAAGVSIVSVSNALNDRDGLSFEKRSKILRIASELGYDLRSKKNKKECIKFGLLCDDIGWNELFEKAAGKYEIEITDDPYVICDGYIIAKKLSAPELRLFVDTHKPPSVGVMFVNHDVDTDYVTDDGFHDAAKAVRMLIDKGCRRIAVAADIDDDELSFDQIKDRIFGVYCQIPGLDLREFDYSNAVASADYRQFLTCNGLPDGLVCIGSGTEKKILENFEKRNISVPESIRIVTCSKASDALQMPSVVYDEYEIAERAVKLLLTKIKNNEKSHGVSLVQGKIHI